MDVKNLERVAGEITAAGGQVAYAKCNVTSDEQVADLMDLAIARFGALNICVASAGIIKDGLMINTDKETGKVKRAMTTEQFKAVIDVNLVGSFVTLREAALRMVEQRLARRAGAHLLGEQERARPASSTTRPPRPPWRSGPRSSWASSR
jgi:NAD(P)-dependent dehydrogenase (short-subunit alcohol dehydrogenase family)